jgi:hypothetical protein
MSEENLINLDHLVTGLDTELTDQTKALKSLRDRIIVLETDILTVIAIFQKLRAFAHVHPGLEKQAEEFDILLNWIGERYNISPAAEPA